MSITYCIYALIDHNGVVFYVGQTNNFVRRIKSHAYYADGTSRLYCHNKLRKVMHDHNLTIERCATLIEDGIPEDKIDEREIHYISHFKGLGYLLTNLTEGGRGSKTFSDVIHKKASEKRKGSKRSEETKRKISEARKGMIFSQEHRENLCQARRNRQISLATRSKMSNSSIGKINTKVYIVVDPNGVEYLTKKGLADFCRHHNLTPGNMHKVLTGIRKHHKGWTIRTEH